MFRTKKIIYLDYASATPLDASCARVLRAMEDALYANPSALHIQGIAVHKQLQEARARVAGVLFAHADEIIFTSSGTTSDAQALLGVVYAYRQMHPGSVPHIVTTAIEHPAVLENCNMLVSRGEITVTYVPIDEHGFVSPKDIRAAITPATILVSVMYANNEIGTIQPVTDIAKEVRHARKIYNSSFPLFHTDAAQAINYVPITNIEKLGVDLMSWNSSKIYGPKGVGFLYKKRSVTLAPIYGGGGQEQGLVSGTENTPAIVAASHAFVKAQELQAGEFARLTSLRDDAIVRIQKCCTEEGYTCVLNGSTRDRLPNNINITIEGISSELLVIELDAQGIAVSERSACASKEEGISHVIAALRTAQKKEVSETDGSLRISLGRGTIAGDITVLIKALASILHTYKKWK